MIRTASSTSMLRSVTILTAFACALAIASLLAARAAAASDRDARRPSTQQGRVEHGAAAGQYHWLGRVFPGPFGRGPRGHDYPRYGHRDHGHYGYDDHHSSHRYGHHDYDRRGYRDYDRDSDSHHYVGHDYGHHGYYCSRCHYRTPSRHIFFNHLHHHHHIPWYEAVSYLVWSPIHLVFVFD